ncbi:MAG: hypothetical protein ACLPLZ_04870 [Terracidiphilus sp.]
MSTLYATPPGTITGLLTPAWSKAESSEAQDLSRKQSDVRSDLLKNISVRNTAEHLISELEALASEASCRGWDGYDAAPINPEACKFAMQFIRALPTTGRQPMLSADPDGEVSFEWVFGKRKVLNVSVGATGRCTFAWVSGQRSNRGTDWIEHEIPASIVFALRQLG